MMSLVALLLSAVLVAIAALHALWGAGYWVPIRDEEALVRAVVGVKGATRMPGPIPCALVAATLIVAAGLPWIPDGAIRQTGLALATAGFAIRGLLPFRPGWRRMTPQEPFATYDRRYYGPLCLALALGFLLLFRNG